MSSMHTLTLTPPARTSVSTRIVIGDGIREGIAEFLPPSEKIVLLFDLSVSTIADSVASAIPGCVKIGVKSGDASKSLAEADRIVTAMLNAGCARRSVIVAVGGGMLTDLAGFVASVFMRGVPCVLVPTTLLGMVDAAIGGKTAVNAGDRKNMIGTVTHPYAVVIDTSLLQSLPDPQIREGLSEMVKIAAIADAPYFTWLEEHADQFLKRDAVVLSEGVVRAVSAKKAIVERDEHDRDVRLLLNFGHTVGHAVEAKSGYTIPHGSAVSIGMVIEMALAGVKDAPRIKALLEQIGLPVSLPKDMALPELWIAMQSDKKNEGGEVKIAVPSRLGEGAVQTVLEEKFLSLTA